MTLRQYCEQMGLRVVCDIAAVGFRVRIDGYRLADSCGAPEASADGASPEEARAALVQFIAGRIIRSTLRETYLLWVVSELTP